MTAVLTKIKSRTTLNEDVTSPGDTKTYLITVIENSDSGHWDPYVFDDLLIDCKSDGGIMSWKIEEVELG
jgi:hypothetical protein